MENQHRKISGYRELNQQEVDSMNEIKELAEKVKEAIEKVDSMNPIERGISPLQLEESQRCLMIAKTNLQTGFMWLVRSVALPTTF